MKLIYNNLDVVKWVNENKAAKIGFIPTMGALHKGHLSLVEKAKKYADKIVVSIFVNPTQFGDSNDFINYPCSTKQDLALLEELNVDMVFLPTSAEELYSIENYQPFSFNSIDSVMEGSYREGHFDGVVRVVKLFLELIQPDFAFFGEKDYQQLLIIKKLIDNIGVKTKIISCQTLREKDGLAMSSRNRRLSASDRALAANLYKVLSFCKEKYSPNSIAEMEKVCLQKLAEFSIPDYFEIRNAEDLSKKGSIDTKWRAFTATKIGEVRLIDNIALN